MLRVIRSVRPLSYQKLRGRTERFGLITSVQLTQ